MTCYKGPPAYIILAFLGFWGCFHIYALKLNLSVAIVKMVQENLKSNESLEHDTNTTSGSSSEKEGYFNWDQYTQGIILGCYFYGFAITPLIGGRLSELVSAKWLYGLGILGSSAIALVSPVAVCYSKDLFIAVRIMQGILSGLSQPVLHILLVRWIPHERRSFIASLVYTGRLLGTAAALVLSGYMIDKGVLGGWPSAFYVFGIIGCAWFPLWIIFVHDFPEKHPRISQKELEDIQLQNKVNLEGEIMSKKIPWRQILLSGPVWALCASSFGNSYGLETLTTELPKYMDEILYFEIEENGILSCLPFILDAITGTLAAYISDVLVQRGLCTMTFMRKFCAALAYAGSAACYGTVTYLSGYPIISFLVFLLCLGFSGIAAPSILVVQMDMSPEYAGTLMGLTSFFGNIAGFISPYIIGVFTENTEHDVSAWRKPFFIVVGVYVFITIVFCIWGSAERQNWSSDKNPEPVSPNVQLTRVSQNGVSNTNPSNNTIGDFTTRDPS